MFKFGFSSEAPENDAPENSATEIQWLESYEIKPEAFQLSDEATITTCDFSDVTIKQLHSDSAISAIKTAKNGASPLLSADQNHSDLVPAVYEGGLKVWECTYDLINYLVDNQTDLKTKTVLDLGCGAGLLGIFASLNGAKTCFQDYNAEVITGITIPNASLNGLPFEDCAFYCGDWDSFAHLAPQHHFDYIFTSETIYNAANYTKLLRIFAQLLKTTGTVYLAAKSHYFGVGGGIPQFQEQLDRAKLFHHETAWECSDGVKRAIIKITLL